MLTSIAILDSGARAVSAPRNDLTGRRFGLLTVPGFDADALIRFFKMR